MREGLEDTLTVLRLAVPPTLARTLRSTNCVGKHDRKFVVITPATSNAGGMDR
jgi:hypothetical protein